MVLELVKGDSLQKYLNSCEKHCLNELEAMQIFKQILSAIAYCHSKGISHRDLKLENILITDKKTIKIIDFGFSVWSKKEKKLKVFCGTPTYMAPEIISKSEYEGPPTDIWAMGIILYTLLCGVFPFNSKIH